MRARAFFIPVQNAPVRALHPSQVTARIPGTVCQCDGAALTSFTYDQHGGRWDAAGEGPRGPTRSELVENSYG